MVDTCPNCGQPSRAGARFCTSCGFRLPERTVESESAPLSRSPFATTSTVAASRWPSSPSSEAPNSVASTTPEPVAVDAPTEGSRSELPDEIALPGPATSDQPAEAIELAAASETVEVEPALETEPQLAPEPEPEPSYPVWPSFPSYGATAGNDTPAWYAQDFPSDPEVAEDPVQPEVDQVAERSFEETPPDNVDTPPASESDPLATYVGSYESATNGADSSSEAIAVPAPSAFEPDPVVEPVSQPHSETLERAQALLAELSALLPTLWANATTSPDSSSVVAESLAAVKGDETEFDALMEAVALVRARPRDIDVVLGLSRHVEAIVTLKERYDQSQAAINEALSHLDTE